MSHGGGGPAAVVMRRPDGTPMTRDEVIRERRGAFRWLPILCSNDLVHGSWWFVWGSLLSMVIAIVPLAESTLKIKNQTDDSLPRLDQDVTWSLLVICGFFYTVGSYAFVRAFEEPPKLPMFHYIRHLQSDELLGAWLFLFGTIPAIPWSLVYFSLYPGFTYMALLILAIVAVIGCCLFVLACYPNDRKAENYLLPCCVQLVGPRIWMVKHLANDWLAGTWFFLWVSALMAFGSFIYAIIALSSPNTGKEQVFVFTSGFIDAMMFLIGSLYFVSGSYPHASQFYYAIDRSLTTSTSKPVEKRKIHAYKRKDDVVQLKIGSTASGGIGTTSQSMDLRLDITVNPIHEQAIKSSAGDRNVGSNTHEIRDKLHNTVATISRGGTISKDKPSSSSSSANISVFPARDVEEGATTINPMLSSSNADHHIIASPISPSKQMETILEDHNLEDDDVDIEENAAIDASSPLNMVSASARAKEQKLAPRYG